jgi:hypothetical protein
MIKLANSVFASVLRRYYTEEKLSDLLEIKVSSQPSGLKVTCSELPRSSVWIDISNLSPFHVIAHELEADLYMPDRVAKFVEICDLDIKAKATERVFMETDLTVKQVEYIRKHTSCPMATLKIKALLNCRLSSLRITDRKISVKNVQFVNCGHSWRGVFN